MSDFVSAGRILIIPRGDWDVQEEYKLLDLVRHNKVIYIAKKTSVNIAPDADINEDYWFKFYEPGTGLEDKANGKGITFTVENGVPYLEYEDNTINAAMQSLIDNIYDDDPSNDAAYDAEAHDIVENVYDDDPANDVSASYPDIDAMIHNIYG